MSDESRSTRRRLDYAGVITRLRRERGMTREALAEASGVSASYLSEVERGYKRPSTDVLAALAHALGMAPSALLALVEESTVGPEVAVFGMTPPGRRRWAGMARMSEVGRRMIGDIPAAQFEAGESTIIAAEGESAPQPRESLIGRLVSLASTLTEEDLRMLIDLARRLQVLRR